MKRILMVERLFELDFYSVFFYVRLGKVVCYGGNSIRKVEKVENVLSLLLFFYF